MIFFTLNIKLSAQIVGDNNWNATPYFIDDFNVSGRYWGTNWFDYPLLKWRGHSVDSGVTHGNCEHQVYQKENCVFNNVNQTMDLTSQYVGGPMDCVDFTLPPGGYSCPTDTAGLYYFSGEIDVLKYEEYVYNVKYGYFEIKCKLPVHRGAFPAFWLYRAGADYYEEIDIFEYAWGVTLLPGSPYFGNPRMFTSGLYYDDYITPSTLSLARDNYVIPAIEPDLTAMNTFACEWTPGRIVWYFNNQIVNEYYGQYVPSHHMVLKANYALDNYIWNDGSVFSDGFPYKMEIDYIKVHKLKCDCDENATIINNTQLYNFDYGVKESISIGYSKVQITVPASTKLVFRATDYIEITQSFECPLGSELELITHPCPE
jgi:hypothetical protein